ncbi:ribosome biogenesis GTPase Der [Candidatus Arthromitus sp. SFB-turkey]|uniref:ribosome biogenesis GTPase Der n=1 Tax=Candidatus Arthromitus sp. SFB-turkey TaxID=1840217 RepID=UPI0007F51CC9|nr:ribosome biogenesis GTPase Der [Candidatus Arthromitus sp. SFB-turkey]OAT87607.1 ribosome biogenesis GTPase Der [Candidatus Arthromitus sp. SFB-turkey]
MKKPIVAIVGRPNVGKSTLFNRIVGDRVSIVDDTPGVTRDRIYRDAEWLKYKFTLIDTGGIEFKTNDDMFKNMRIQTELAIETADVIIFIVDGKTGLVDGDREVARMLRKSKKDIILVVNKIDSKKDEMNLYEFYEFGLGEPIPISSTQSLGLGDMLDEVVKYFDVVEEENEEDDIIKIAVVGKPNVGKSSLINKILGQTRSIVSDIAGTTRDSIDTYFENETEKFILIDTAGLRKKSKIKENVEHYSVIRSLYSIDRCDVCILVIDATQGVTEQDEKILGYAHERNKAILIVVNKWDMINKDNNTYNEFKKNIQNSLSFVTYAPYLFISALTGQRVQNVLKLAKKCYENYSRRIPTGILNEIIGRATMIKEPPIVGLKRLKIYYCTQVDIKPPKFIFFINDESTLHFSYTRYLHNQIRESFDFEGTGIDIQYKERKEKK